MRGKELILELFGDDVRPPITNVIIYFELNGKNYWLGIGNDESFEISIDELKE